MKKTTPKAQKKRIRKPRPIGARSRGINRNDVGIVRENRKRKVAPNVSPLTIGTTEIMSQPAALAKCRLMDCALVVEKPMTWDEGLAAFKSILTLRGASFWWMGDLLSHMQGSYAERFAELFTPENMPAYEVESCRNALWVAQRVPILHRNRHTPISVYQAVAKLETERQKEVLERVEKESLTRNQVREMISRRRDRTEGQTAHNSGPVIALEAVSAFAKDMDRALQALPIDKWTPEALSTVQVAFDSAVKQTRIAYGWQRQEA